MTTNEYDIHRELRSTKRQQRRMMKKWRGDLEPTPTLNRTAQPSHAQHVYGHARMRTQMAVNDVHALNETQREMMRQVLEYRFAHTSLSPEEAKLNRDLIAQLEV
jgi:hypothetical protein